MISYKDKGKDYNYEKVEGKIWQKRRFNRKWGTCRFGYVVRVDCQSIRGQEG